MRAHTAPFDERQPSAGFRRVLRGLAKPTQAESIGIRFDSGQVPRLRIQDSWCKTFEEAWILDPDPNQV